MTQTYVIFLITLLWECEVFTASGQDTYRQPSELLAQLTADPTIRVIPDCQSIWLEVNSGPFYLMQWALMYTRRNNNKLNDTNISTREKLIREIRTTRDLMIPWPSIRMVMNWNTVEPLISRLRLTVNSINGASHRYAISLHFQCAGGSCERIVVRISTPENIMASERANKRKRVVLNNVFWRTFSRNIPQRRTYGKR
jgi:hypothetical protein